MISASGFHAQYLQTGYQNPKISELTPKKLQFKWPEHTRLEACDMGWERSYFSKARIILYRFYSKLIYSLYIYDSIPTQLYREQQTPSRLYKKMGIQRLKGYTFNINKSNWEKIQIAYLFMSLSGNHISLLLLTDPLFHIVLFRINWERVGRTSTLFWVTLLLKGQKTDGTFKITLLPSLINTISFNSHF